MGIELDPGAAGAIVATDTIAGEEFQLFKLVDGAEDGTARIGGDAANGLDVDVTRSALPTGAATSAKQDTIIGHVDGIEGVLGTIDADTGNISTKIDTVAGAVAGSEMQVDVVTLPALPAGNNNIGDVDIASIAAGNNNIGDVDVASLPGSLAGIADDAAFTVATSVVLPVGYLADQASTDSVNEGDVGAARMTLDRKQIVTVAPSADTEGWDVFSATSGDTLTALTATAQAVKASAGKLGGWYIYNPNATAAYVIIYDIASGSVTVGTSTPKMVICIPATSGANVEFVNGIAFGTAISVAATTTGPGNTAPTTALEANFLYK
jgi:hypothetical protein